MLENLASYSRWRKRRKQTTLASTGDFSHVSPDIVDWGLMQMVDLSTCVVEATLQEEQIHKWLSCQFDTVFRRCTSASIREAYVERDSSEHDHLV